MFLQPLLIITFVTLISSSHIPYSGNGRSSPDLKLVKLAILLRHGDRSPYMTFPTNPYPYHDLRHWPDGPDQLTVNGKKRMYDVGLFIGTRYSDFLSGDPIEVYARSSPADRCLNSAALVLAAAFPPRGRLRFRPSLNWQPIPVHTEKDGLEIMLNTPSRSPCPALKRAKELQRGAQDVRDFERDNRKFMHEVGIYAGMTVETLADVDRVYDSLITAKEDGKRLPEWVTDQLLNRMRRLDEKTYCIASSTPLIQRLETGFFWDELKNKFLNETGPQKVFIYSTHDSRMSSFLRLVNGYDGGHPKYGASIFFELLQHISTGQRFVRVFLLDETWSHKVKRLEPDGCDGDSECSADTFFHALEDFTVDENSLLKECQVIPNQSQETACFTESFRSNWVM